MNVVGAIVMWGSENVPENWHVCDGTQLEIERYPDLYDRIGKTFGANPDDGHFYLPDLRGRFIRGVDAGAGRDPDVNSRKDMQDSSVASTGAGSVQGHGVADHTHNYGSHIVPYSDFWTEVDGVKIIMDAGKDLATCAEASGNPNNNRGGDTRPINAYLYFIICIQEAN